MSARRGDTKTTDSDEKDEDEVHSLQYKIILLGDGAVGKVILHLTLEYPLALALFPWEHSFRCNIFELWSNRHSIQSTRATKLSKFHLANDLSKIRTENWSPVAKPIFIFCTDIHSNEVFRWSVLTELQADSRSGLLYSEAKYTP